MKTNYKLGGVLAALAAVIGIIGHYILFNQFYQLGMHAEAAEPGCEILLEVIHPILANMGLLAAALFSVSAYGFFTQRKWAFSLSVVGFILALLGSFFVNIPFLAASYFLMMVRVQKVSWARTLLALATGITYILCWMNGIASTSRIITIGADIFILVQKLHFVSMLGWGVVTAGILIKPREWQRVLALTSGATQLIVGIPLAIVTTQELGRFSLFSLAPLLSFILVILLVIPGLWKKWTKYDETIV